MQEEVITNKWQARIEKRRNDAGSRNVVHYVDGLIRGNGVLLSDVASFLMPSEIQDVQTILDRREQEAIESAARAEADRLERERRAKETQAALDEFYRVNPPPVFETVPPISSKSELFDFFAACHISKVTYVIEGIEYHWDEFQGIEDASIIVTLTSGLEVSLYDLPPFEFDDDDAIDEFYGHIQHTIKDIATNKVCDFDGKIYQEYGEDASVILDIAKRTIRLEATAEVTRVVEEEWGLDA
jgi:hypothetical protein